MADNSGAWDFTGLKAMYVNCTLKRSPPSPTPRRSST